MGFELAIAGVAAAIFVAILAEWWLKRGKAVRPLAKRMHDGMPKTAETKKPLGMEATDLESVERSQKMSETVTLKNHNTNFK
ncbi:MAG: hypothetical protein L3J37_06215 [Rhodobacteraceae bacterium]|nr:hypothetical protein [Paracoccaceae bacterium]